MAIETIWAIGESHMTISGGEQLSGFSQGDGSHLDDLTITLNSASWEQILIDDGDGDFEDNQGNQRLSGDQTFDGVDYAGGLRMEAEYTLVLEAANGTQYTVIGVNFNEPGQNPAYGTVEGLAFVDDGNGFPPVGEPLTVVSSSEGPRTADTPYSTYFTPPCFVSGTQIDTPMGPRVVETLGPGDLVVTMDNGPQPLRWRATTEISASELVARPELGPVEIAPGAFGPGMPARRLAVSPQHRVLCGGPIIELWFGAPEGLAAAGHLVDGKSVRMQLVSDSVTYHHLLFDRHEIILAEGLPTESFRPGPMTQAAVPPALLARLRAEHPGFAPEAAPARPILSRRESNALRAA